MRAHNGKIGFSLWRYLNLLDLHSLETLAEWTAKAAVLVSLCGQVAHATPVDTIIQFASTYAFLLRSADVILALSLRTCLRMHEYGGGMNELPYPSDLTAAQWALIEPLLPAPKPKGRKRRVDLRKITNAIFYVLKGGISWRMLPREFAPWKTVYHYFRLWRLAGLWDRIHDQLRDQVRVSKGRHIYPSAAIVDSQSVATQQKGAIGATMLRSAPRVVSGISWSMYWV